ncbi:peptidoglycan bridge formation glycyltransferase FemA/FemB family protein [Candidatus Saccharibacteria bacterium]|nr:peptidoglycan bridge formation glycyltransferase FemA/FemB family protein [Candidatus Saccharibacteria bacterium]
MNFATIDGETFREFASKSKYKSFMQTPEIAKLREQSGWTVYYFAVTEESQPNAAIREVAKSAARTSSGAKPQSEKDSIIAAAMLVAKPSFLGKSVFHCPGGPLLDYENKTLLHFFVKNLKSFIKSHNGYVLHIDPYYEINRYDRNGEPLSNYKSHQEATHYLESLGFSELKDASQPKYLFVMELDGRTPDQILSDFKRNTRNHVKKAEKKGVKVRELKREELGTLKRITESTSKRRNFTDRSLSYYEQMYDLFAPRHEVKFLVAEADGIPLSAAMFMLYGDEVVYLFSGSDEKYMKEYNAQYAIQWHMIKYAAEHGYKIYNFYGIHGLPDKSDPDYGIYDFKKGFGADYGRIVELIGTFELPANKPFFYLHQLLSKLKHH